jgi:hypothetical protein
MALPRPAPPSSARPFEGIVLFASLPALFGVRASPTELLANALYQPHLERASRLARFLSNVGIELIVRVATAQERHLADVVGISPWQESSLEMSLERLSESVQVPRWRTAAVGDAASDVPLLETASVPFWLALEAYPGQRGVVQLPPGDVATVGERLQNAWLPEFPVERRPTGLRLSP